MSSFARGMQSGAATAKSWLDTYQAANQTARERAFASEAQKIEGQIQAEQAAQGVRTQMAQDEAAKLNQYAAADETGLDTGGYKAPLQAPDYGSRRAELLAGAALRHGLTDRAEQYGQQANTLRIQEQQGLRQMEQDAYRRERDVITDERLERQEARQATQWQAEHGLRKAADIRAQATEDRAAAEAERKKRVGEYSAQIAAGGNLQTIMAGAQEGDLTAADVTALTAQYREINKISDEEATRKITNLRREIAGARGDFSKVEALLIRHKDNQDIEGEPTLEQTADGVWALKDENGRVIMSSSNMGSVPGWQLMLDNLDGALQGKSAIEVATTAIAADDALRKQFVWTHTEKGFKEVMSQYQKSQKLWADWINEPLNAKAYEGMNQMQKDDKREEIAGKSPDPIAYYNAMVAEKAEFQRLFPTYGTLRKWGDGSKEVPKGIQTGETPPETSARTEPTEKQTGGVVDDETISRMEQTMAQAGITIPSQDDVPGSDLLPENQPKGIQTGKEPPANIDDHADDLDLAAQPDEKPTEITPPPVPQGLEKPEPFDWRTGEVYESVRIPEGAIELTDTDRQDMKMTGKTESEVYAARHREKYGVAMKAATELKKLGGAEAIRKMNVRELTDLRQQYIGILDYLPGYKQLINAMLKDYNVRP